MADSTRIRKNHGSVDVLDKGRLEKHPLLYERLALASARIEELLEQLVAQNLEIINRLDELIYEAKEIHGEVDWSADLSFAKAVCDSLSQIESATGNSETTLQSIETSVDMMGGTLDRIEAGIE
jgi:Rad3-related DNA helicase